MSRPTFLALPIAYVTLRILIVLNWIYGAAVFGLVVFANANRPFFLRAIDVPQNVDPRPIMIGLTAIATLGLIAVPLNHSILTRLTHMVRTVQKGDPFVRTNAYRLNAIAWCLFGLQVLSLIIGLIGKSIASKQVPLHLDAGFSISGWLAVLLTFILARVFAEGTLMREDLEGTV